MANTTIQLKHSTLTGNVPSSLANGEISINSRVGKFFYSTPASVIITHYPYLGPAGLNKEIQFNDSGTLGSNSGLAFDKSSGIFSTKQISVTNSVGDEGGEILLAKPSTNTTLVGTGITIDSFQNKIRFFEQGGSARGAYIDLTECVGGAGTNILNPTATPDTVARTIANAAFIQANASFLQANTPSATANSAASYANAAFAVANTGSGSSSAGPYANAAFATANSSASYANAAFAQANSAQSTASSAAGAASAAQATADAAYNTNDFALIYTPNNTTTITASARRDTFNIVGESGVVAYANSSTKTITIAGTPGAQGLTVDYGFVADPTYYSIDYGSLA